jgi:hypothetical protein
MLALDFILNTISHFVRDDSGPSPGIPAHASAGFEQDLMKLCESQRISPLISHSLNRLALPPGLSRLAVERLKDSEARIAADSRRLRNKWAQVSTRLETGGVPFLLAGDLAASDVLYPEVVTRPVHDLEILVAEADWPQLAACLGGAGFELTVPQAAGLGPADALEFFQMFTPCVFQDHDGDELWLHFRLFYLGRPDLIETAWDRSVEASTASVGTHALGLEDQLIRAALDFSLGGFSDLFRVVDIGLLIGRFHDQIDWSYFQNAIKGRSLYNELYLSLKRVEKLLNLCQAGSILKSPGRLRESLFNFIWGGSRAEPFLTARTGKRKPDFRQLGYWRFRDRTAMIQDLFDPSPAVLSSFSSGKSTGWDRLEFMWRVLFSAWENEGPEHPPKNKNGGRIIDRKQGW